MAAQKPKEGDVRFRKIERKPDSLSESRSDSRNDLLFFYGTECTHCHKMDPLIEKLEKEEGVKLTKLEVWHNAKNAGILDEYDQGNCGGVPFFFNKKNGTWLCGEVPYEELKDWALGKSG